MRLIYLIHLIILNLSFNLTAAYPDTDAKNLLLKSDQARGGLNEGLEWDVVISTNENSQTSDSTFHVQVKNVNILAVCTAPARQRGETYLFNDRNLWVYRTNLRKPISVSTRLRLSGQTSNGDIATTNYTKDYDAELIGKESIGNEKVIKLLLKAKSRDLTYDQIHYWISEKSGLAVQADFLTLDGKAIKRATYKYENTIQLNGKSAPFISEMIITETAFSQNKSVLKYNNLKNQKFPDNIFNVNNLAR